MSDNQKSFERAFESTTDIDKHAKAVARRVRATSNELQAIMTAVDVDDLTRAEQRAVIRQVDEILTDLDDELARGVESGINDVYEQGRARTLVALGLFANVGAARRYLRSDKATLSRAHRSIRMADIETAMDDLLAMTSNTRRRVKSEIRRVAADMFRTGENVRSQKKKMSKRLREAGVFAIRDRAGRRWKIDHYTNVVVSTKLAEAHRQATEQEAREQGAGYVIVSIHADPCEKCAPWEGRVLRISADVGGAMPTLDEANTGGLFHPNCEHTVTPVRNLEVLPAWAKK